MPRTYEPIASQTLGSDTASVEFSSIPSTYTDLRLVCYVQQTSLAATYARVNGLSTNIYSVTFLRGNGSTADSGRFSATGLGGNGVHLVNSHTISDNAWSTLIADFMSYSNTNVFKTVLSAGGSTANSSATPASLERQVNLIQTTAAISSMVIRPFTGSFRSGSVFSLYGIKAA